MNRGSLSHLNPYELHKHLINEYFLKEPGSTNLLKRDCSKDKTDSDVIRENHRFLWEDENEANTWEKKLAKKYFDKLFKEYTISDLTRFKENKIALRWRIEKEVVTGKGQFICGEKKCDVRDTLRTWEVNFAYMEHGEKKNALVKLRLCTSCSEKLNYHTKKREIKRLKKAKHSNSNLQLINSKHSFKNYSPTLNSGEEGSSNTETVSVITADPKSKKYDEEKGSNEIANNCWTKGPDIEDKSREDEFDEYLENLLL